MNYNVLKLLCTILPVLFFSEIGWAQSDRVVVSDSLSVFDRELSPQEMKEDLQVFIDIRKDMNSGLYRYRTNSQIDSIYNWAFEEVAQPMPTTEFYKIILRLTDFEGSVHNYTEPGSALMDYLKRQKTFFPYHLAYIDGKMIFDGHHGAIPPGARILSINGIMDSTLMQSFYKYFPADGHTVTAKLSASVEKVFGWRYFIEYGLAEEYVVEFSEPGSDTIKEALLPAVSLDQQEENRKNRYSAPLANLLDFKLQPAYSFEMINPSSGLLNLRWFGMATGKDDPAFEVYVSYIDSVFNVLDQKKIPNLIIDVRNNPGGSDPTFEQPVMYLSDDNFKENLEAHIIFDPKTIPYDNYFWGVSTSERIDSLTLAAGMEFLEDYFDDFQGGKSHQNDKYNPVYHPKSPAYKGKVYLLINENVASAASHFASLVKAYARNVIIVGVETVGGYYVHNGHIALVYEMPNSEIKTKFSIVYVVQDAPERPDQPDGRGIIPDYEVWPQLDDFLKQKDTQMEFVLKHIDWGNRPD
ncbi:hypothetical protein J2X69_004338 [Algoriphagus sp. 4150]|uniref:S41 family peptidase n=1 Tax=Algoriphagus sp. 4150 TaxID=2817756 RepID=UPI00286557E6|nr:S41 family peptidase [Algoriphagus sp. 4150]MDR7131972.1 hypothetical protein [Algoriphagus sp. 4150]